MSTAEQDHGGEQSSPSEPEDKRFWGSTTAYMEPGVYTRQPCGCLLYVVEIITNAPRLCLIENDAPCKLRHTLGEFRPLTITAEQAALVAYTYPGGPAALPKEPVK